MVSAFGLGTAALAVAPTSAVGSTDAHALPAPWWLLHPLSEGSRLRHGWSIHTLGSIHDGATVLTLNRTHAPIRVHICLHDGDPKGFAHTTLFDLIVIDHGQGVRTVPDDLASNLMLLSEIISDNELQELRPDELSGISRFMTHTDRVGTFGAGHIK